MSLTTWPLNRKQTADLLPRWQVGELMFLRPAAGTASPAVVAVCRRGQYFLKQRAPRYSDTPRLTYDHALMRHLAQVGLPVAPAIKTFDGNRWVRVEGLVYEIYPWVEGEAFDPTSREQLQAAGDLLARLHQAGESFRPRSHKDLPRLFHPQDRLPEIAEARALLEEGVSPGAFSAPEAARILDRLEAEARGLLERLPDERYWALPPAVVHGDYHPANVKFRGEHAGSGAEIVGLFDWDWACRQARLKDVADGILFFACPRERPLTGDLPSLTQPPLYDADRMRIFREAYEAHLPLTDEERKVLPDMLRERWLYVRLDAMHRKVEREDKLAFLLPGVEGPLEWIESLTP
jgi:Ser/Thr protein kinase RdoA (MazF antagonist)